MVDHQSTTGRIHTNKSQLSAVTQLADHYRQALSLDDANALPLIYFYGVDRYIDDITVKLTSKQHFDQFDGYDNSSASFRHFFAWFRQREDIENEQRMTPSALAELHKHLPEAQFQAITDAQKQFKDNQLEAVRQAITNFIPDYSHLQVRRKPRLHMTIDKGNERLEVTQLSQGEKSLLALIGDIARRLAMMNPKLDNPLVGEGIVMIDEVDMHLHPKWQRSLINKLSQTFPNCQFVLTTHSPLVISDSQNILCYMLNDGELTKPGNLYGQDANQVLMDVMDTDTRNETVQAALGDILDLIQDGDLQTAQGQLDELTQSVSPNNIELMKARLLLRKMEIRREKNR